MPGSGKIFSYLTVQTFYSAHSLTFAMDGVSFTGIQETDVSSWQIFLCSYPFKTRAAIPTLSFTRLWHVASLRAELSLSLNSSQYFFQAQIIGEKNIVEIIVMNKCLKQVSKAAYVNTA